MGWSIKRTKATEGELLIINQKEISSTNPRYLQVNTNKATTGSLGLINEGFKGIGVRKGLRYDFSTLYRQTSKGIKLHVQLLGKNDQVIGEAILEPAEAGTTWKKQHINLTASETEPKARLAIWLKAVEQLIWICCLYSLKIPG